MSIDQPVMNNSVVHPTQTPDTVLEHIEEMISQGFTDEQIKVMHPEIVDVVIQRLRNQ
jgi:hypothetical protein